MPSPGACGTDGEDAPQCEQWVMHITDHRSLDRDPERPEVFRCIVWHTDSIRHAFVAVFTRASRHQSHRSTSKEMIIAKSYS